MKPIADFVRQHFLLLFLLLFAVQLIRRIFRHWKHGVRFPRRGGARHCLRATVTDQEIAVRSPFPFSLIVESDLEHRMARTWNTGGTQLIQRLATGPAGV